MEARSILVMEEQQMELNQHRQNHTTHSDHPSSSTVLLTNETQPSTKIRGNNNYREGRVGHGGRRGRHNGGQFHGG